MPVSGIPSASLRHGIALFFNWDIYAVCGLVIAYLYLLPSIRAWQCCAAKNRKWFWHIFFLNGILGWTLIGWWYVWRRTRWSGPALFAHRTRPRFFFGNTLPTGRHLHRR